ncbi:30S ribosomal protein S20 [Candidatus Roizmanbacteria bacterium CG22_combo_CG10-13_8_21_14_all_35_9]|uniref:Small ribosomal subunit protein bS20 n=4 Tax=Candidatus Roizmaniibacteriota TaxID=1752723 RepID=A0A2M8F4P5_9BACT|nr:MAG: 30S ribosomal protein S20 [Candidatus Roizmanbacteria bacterium CG23_combo_of_CG06-09_8_20_14_all_35_49]PIP62266.1 MAG: 30S ribosomal protein S20 [Candidatus Roizmanbacteria bacterium CG22_combo_CG10-13_8_21_14_all_35_9]PIY70863.1 MAG: 30S ribosomal protein S20 [Candidatus Roizmanbacteria bacterium CG_4_10_14_0_8_um_filter_35_28]PJC34274.1 MAG: 30S ribosomal protein S20 [Candidatus Roizmanbacteria bacterium CG_4_9_14_0_2_um_filter_35_15]PJC82838.1 MAG: 30S ribosomal protein S20 [Candida
MPIIKSAKKKLRQDKKRSKQNFLYIKAYKETLRIIKKGGKGIKELVSRFYSQVDKAAKVKVIHKNKAKRLKSEVSKLINKNKK